jgi:hypothetical protein
MLVHTHGRHMHAARATAAMPGPQHLGGCPFAALCLRHLAWSGHVGLCACHHHHLRFAGWQLLTQWACRFITQGITSITHSLVYCLYSVYRTPAQCVVTCRTTTLCPCPLTIFSAPYSRASSSQDCSASKLARLVTSNTRRQPCASL